jgi:DNA-binding transcriptional LysR family regulator
MAQLENFRLKVFRAVAEYLSFHQAAEHLFLRAQQAARSF